MAVKSLAQSSILQPSGVNSLLGDYESNYFHHLETVRLGGSAASVTFSNLAQYSDYQHLQIRMVGVTSADSNVRFRLNGDTGNNYAFHNLYGSGSGTPISGAVTSTNGGYLGYSKLTATNSICFGAVLDLLDAYETNKYKTGRCSYGNRHSSTDPLVMLNSSLWQSTNALTQISFYPESGTLNAGSRFSLYGLKARS
jgi:hypothetical protein